MFWNIDFVGTAIEVLLNTTVSNHYCAHIETHRFCWRNKRSARHCLMGLSPFSAMKPVAHFTLLWPVLGYASSGQPWRCECNFKVPRLASACLMRPCHTHQPPFSSHAPPMPLHAPPCAPCAHSPPCASMQVTLEQKDLLPDMMDVMSSRHWRFVKQVYANGEKPARPPLVDRCL